jgi:hypothetical protein
MLQEAKYVGLLIDARREARVMGRSGGGYVTRAPSAMMHESLKGSWRLAEFLPKRRYDPALQETRMRPNLFARRVIPRGSLVHEAAYQRGDPYIARLPPNVLRTTTLTDPVPIE